MKDKMTLREKLLAIQCELNVPKNQRNKFGNYNYRSCEDILEALKPLLKKYKTILTISDKIVKIGDRYYVKAIAELGRAEGSISLTISSYAREAEVKKGMDVAQITGAASSYARKYALNGLFGIDDSKDPDSTNKHEDIPAESQMSTKDIDNIEESLDKFKKGCKYCGATGEFHKPGCPGAKK